MKDGSDWNPLAPRPETDRPLYERAFRRLAPRVHRRWDRARRIKKSLAYLGGANFSPQHPLFLEALTRRGSGDVVEYTVLFSHHPHRPVLVRAGTADPNPFRQVFLEHFYIDAIVPGFEPRYILDLGANVGYATLWFAMHYPAARLCAVEPLPSTAARLRAQLQASGVMERAVVLENAIDKQAGTRALYVDDDDFLHQATTLMKRASISKKAGLVECIPLDEILKRSSFPHFDLIKFDVEGIEEILFTNTDRSFDEVIAKASVVTGELKDVSVREKALGYFRERGWRHTVRGETVTFRNGNAL